MNSPKHSTHHLLAKSKWGSNNRDNLVELRHVVHQSIHNVFWTEIFPEQMKRLIGINYTALREDVVMDLLEVLAKRDEHNLYDRYKPECINK